LNDAAYLDLAVAGAASAPFHPHEFTDCAKTGAANTAANATAAISVFMVSLHPTHYDERARSPAIEFELGRESVTLAEFTTTCSATAAIGRILIADEAAIG
jgi:hypothetical protein